MGGRALGQRSSNLPAEPTSFVGRRQELREVKRLLGTTRLLTLTGSGREIAARLFLSERTVEAHVTHMFDKLA